MSGHMTGHFTLPHNDRCYIEHETPDLFWIEDIRSYDEAGGSWVHHCIQGPSPDDGKELLVEY